MFFFPYSFSHLIISPNMECPIYMISMKQNILRKMKITVLDGYTLNPRDLDWESLAALGELEVHG